MGQTDIGLVVTSIGPNPEDPKPDRISILDLRGLNLAVYCQDREWVSARVRPVPDFLPEA
mgnify:CR=1 FL=1